MDVELWQFEIIDHIVIPLTDEIKLGAKLWKPISKDPNQKFSIVLEYLPYRKTDGTVIRDSKNHDWLAARGFGVARVDIRGSGDSTGTESGEYTKEELSDGCKVIEWLSQLDWCTGSIGVFGKSWGGFNGLQLAALKPKGLRGVVSLYSTDDRYADDVHYMGGCVAGSEALSWATVMLAANAQPPDSENFGPGWKDEWRKRLDQHEPWLHDWMSHQTRDQFWKHGSICEDFGAVQCPILAIGGWTDGYFNAVFRLLAGLQSFRKGIVGPWSHEWPNLATPGPQVAMLEICRLWWDHTLNGVENEVIDYPDLQLYVKHWTTPQPAVETWPGKWISIPQAGKLGGNLITTSMYQHSLVACPSKPGIEKKLGCLPLQGAWSGEWLSFGQPDLPGEQRYEDSFSLSWESIPLREAIEIIGFPIVGLELKSSEKQSLIFVRLCDVDEMGSSMLITRGALNLSHRDGSEFPAHLPPDEFHTIKIKLNACGYKVQQGHRLRICITPSYWPMVWPPPVPNVLTIAEGQDTWLSLPTVLPKDQTDDVPILKHPVSRPAALKTITVREGKQLQRNLNIGQSDSTQVLTILEDSGITYLYQKGISTEDTATKIYTIDPACLSPEVTVERNLSYKKLNPEGMKLVASLDNPEQQAAAVLDAPSEWWYKIRTLSKMTSDKDNFILTDHLVVDLDEQPFFEKSWTKTIPRHFV